MPMPAKAWILAGCFALAGPAYAVSSYLVKDINTTSSTDSSDPGFFVSLGGRALFFTDTGLWASDGSAAGTVKLADERFLGFLAVGTHLAYALKGTASQFTLWVTDGTPGGTLPLSATDLSFTVPGAILRGYLALGTERLFFAADDGQHGSEIWTSDGTAAGTRRVADLAPGAASSQPFGYTSFRNRIFFVADDGRGFSLWSMDATGTNPKLVKDPDPRSRQFSALFDLAVVGQTLHFFFAATDGTFLWKSDGTGTGTVPVAKILPAGATAGFVLDSVVQLGRLFFLVDEGTRGRELWVSNGTAAGTRRLTDFVGATAGPFEFFPLQLPGKPLLFMAGDAAHGNEYWVSNGTPAGTRLLKDICLGACSGLDSYPLTSFRGRLYFQGRTSATGGEFWSTDATAAGTRMLKDACPGPCDSTSFPIASAGGKLYFQAIDTDHGDQVWRTDGTTAGTRRLSDFPPIPFLDRYSGAAAGPVLVFRGYDFTHGLELWSSRGTPQTTTFLAQLGTTFPGSSEPVSFYAAGSRVIFSANDGFHGSEIWGSDGTADGTLRVRPDAASSSLPFIPNAISAEHFAYFTQTADSGRSTLWRSDGTPAGTFAVTPPDVAVQTGSEKIVIPRGDTCYFVGEDDTHGAELWTTDGTVANTHLVADLRLGPEGSQPQALRRFLGRLQFYASNEAVANGHYVSDGTLAGTKLVTEAYPFLDGFGLFTRASSDAKALISRRLSGGAVELWSTDGTEAGTRFVLGNLEHVGGNLSASGGRFLFEAGVSVEDLGIYLSDGTAGGTVRIASDLGLSYEVALQAVGERFVFSAFRINPSGLALWTTDGTPGGTHPLIETESELQQPRFAARFAGGLLLTGGDRIWLSDGTPAGTSILVEIKSLPFGGPASAVASDRAYFPMSTPELGTELWAFRPD
jgi:ELWxxDGT repeat protein